MFPHEACDWLDVPRSERDEHEITDVLARAIAHLVDKATIVDDVFRGYADPATSPLARRPVRSRDLRWDGRDPPTPFPGENGTLDVERARDRFATRGIATRTTVTW
ncbi:hypothetical protein [Haloplanus aerogenes]|uniref:Uncharacterized protein n=1 Tax=Haloplanus aerogenes TaxID=660522 RepID=A0A3M0DB05_9EURY|nr:hypothetical protein ATH50_1968 [Haloplanus aerogenes]